MRKSIGGRGYTNANAAYHNHVNYVLIVDAVEPAPELFTPATVTATY